MNHFLASRSLLVIAVCAATACSKADPPQAASPGAPASPPAPRVARAALGASLPATLCGVLRKMVPEVKGMPAVGARAQLVMAIAAAFDSDATALGTVSSDIDTIASAGCTEVRAPLLAATKATSLQEAVR
jgi:hypothetical protein